MAMIYRAVASSAFCLMLVSHISGVSASSTMPQEPGSTKQIVTTMLANEDIAVRRKDHYAYLSKERSDRTGGHLWTEKVVETNAGKVHMLLAEDGLPLSSQRSAQERGRLAAIVADPASFQRREQTLKSDETHAKQMLSLLPKAFILSNLREQGGELRIDFSPDPSYTPQSMEERVLHGMSGTLLIDAKTLRLHHIDGRLPEDVSIGYGLLATIRAGSSFATTRDPVANTTAFEWKTASIDTNINGKAILFKSIAKKQHTERSNYAQVPNDLSVAQAVAIAEQ
jgi:hypothetical protein